MPALIVCPDAQVLKEFILGQCSSASSAEVASHIEGCSYCLATLKTLSAEDTLVEAIRAQQTVTEDPEQDVVRRLVARVRSMLPAAQSQLDRTLDAVTPPVSLPGSLTHGVQAENGDDAAENDGFAPPQAPDEIGRLGGYRILKVLGVGGMGKVFLAEDSQLRRRVALKVMKPTIASNATPRQRFLQEARLAAAIEHDNIVHIYQVGEDRGIPFLAMQLLNGKSLEEVLKRHKALDVKNILRISIQVAEGLAAAHEHNLIHRDIKPANIWIEPTGGGRVKILDFGLARSTTDDVSMTQSGAILGTPSNMPPEQARGEKVDPRCDLYSLGCVMYRMATGELPLKGNNTMAMLVALALNEPTAPVKLRGNLPQALSDLIVKLLAKDRNQRPGSAKEVVKALRAIERSVNSAVPGDTHALSRVPSKPQATKGPSASPVTGPRTNPTARLDKPAVKPAPARTSAANAQAAPTKVAAAKAPPPRTKTARRFFLGIGATVALLLLLGGGYAIYQIIIRDKDGNEVARIKVPEGGKAEVVPDGKPEDSKYTPWAATPEQQVWIDHVAKLPLPQQLESVTRRMVAENKVPVELVLEPQDGPPTKCKVTPAYPVAYVNVIWPLLALPSLRSLDLTQTAVTDFTPLARLPLTELQADLIVDNVKSEAALKSMATLKTVNGRPAAEYWAEHAEIRKDIDDRVVNARALPVEDRMAWFIPVMKKLTPPHIPQNGPGFEENTAKLDKDPTTGWTTVYFRGGFDVSPVRALGVDAIHLYACSVCDLTPVAKSKIQSFGYSTFPGYFGPLRDLSPLAGLPLKQLDLSGAPGVADLSPLAGMKLESFSLHDGSGVTDIKVLLDMPITSLTLPQSITDLRPFKGMKLKSLACSTADISPLAGMPLESLGFGNPSPADLSPLAGMKLKQFSGQYRSHYEPDEKMLRAMPLETINGNPAAQFWAEQDAAKKALQEFVEATAKLTPAEAVEAMKTEMKKFTGTIECSIADGAVVEAKVGIYSLSMRSNAVAPVKALSKLKKITIQTSVEGWTDLSPLLNLPIEEIACNPAMIAGNTIILRQMPKLKTINGKPAADVLKEVEAKAK